ncbi:hypothetical protein BT96DRAFT_951666 [Gymnopus androsaceus JB14]|uniref:Uncharacterized protein n=1 Tax=Gymnopus androsaceus JB14 TaxID=1447944 RepID=A0A6A4GC56_9AGAR|nr:hypothetical protein BT96DRAFT_951666 [Gymnopus androsaceus JB14]
MIIESSKRAFRVQDLAAEILSLIFLFVCEEYSMYDPFLPPQLILAHVCLEWQRTAHNTPRLWSTLYLKLHPRHFGDYFESLSSLQATSLKYSGVVAWLERSGVVPLTIYFLDNGIVPHDEVRAIFHSIIPFLRRCQKLKLVCTATALPSDLDLPCLESLSLDLWSFSDTPSLDPGFSRAPRLRQLQIDTWLLENHLFNLVPHIRPPFSQLTILRIEGYTRNPLVYLRALMCCKNLERCHITLPAESHTALRVDYDLSAAEVEFEHPTLSGLSLRVATTEGVDTITHILSKARIPRLADLYIAIESPANSWERVFISVLVMLDFFAALSTKSGQLPYFRRLQLSRANMSFEYLRGVLESFPTITFIGLYDCDFDIGREELVAAITSDHADQEKTQQRTCAFEIKDTPDDDIVRVRGF